MTRLPIFILGIAQRSGTNYLHDLLALHPDCAMRKPPTLEDYLLRHSDHLLAYAGSLSPFWEEHWKFGGQEAALLQALGDGLASFLAAAAPGKRVLTKTPSVYNIDHLPKLFPHAHLLILVRDGRAVAESTYRSFQRSYEYTARMWAYGAKLIRSFLEAREAYQPRKHLLVRYEDLVRDTRGEMRKILDFLELDADAYDFDAAENIPVRGSSVHRGSTEKLHWDPVQKTENFKPLNRFAHWSQGMHNRFNWIAGKELEYFGYSLEPDGGGWLARLLNRGRDARFKLAALAGHYGWPRKSKKPTASEIDEEEPQPRRTNEPMASLAASASGTEDHVSSSSSKA
jgi:hypothetical protein